MLTLFTDTDTDMTPEVASEYGYKLISMPYHIDGESFYPFKDSDSFDYVSYYDKLRAGTVPTTSAITEESYLEYFEPDFAAGNDILYVHFSRGMTASFNAMDRAVATLKEKYPERKFYAINTKAITIASYLIVREAGDLLKAGKTPEEVVEWAEKEVGNYAQYFFADDLKFFHRSGRVGGLSATMGGLIGLRPVIYINPEGKMDSIGIVKGRVAAVERLVKYVEDFGDDIKSHRFVVGHTGSPALAAQLVDMLHARFGDDLQIETICTNPTAGAHCGPNGAGVAFHSKGRQK